MKDYNYNNKTIKLTGTDSYESDIYRERLSKIDSVIASEYTNINGIIVMHRNKIILEKYYNGYNSHDSFHVASITKSVISALIGIAIDKKFIRSIDDKVLNFFPEYKFSSYENQRQDVTIRQLLTMTVPYPFEDWNEPLDKLCMNNDWIKYTLSSLGSNGKLGDFKYCSAGAHLLSAILTRATGKSAREFANEYLFIPAEMNMIPDYKIDEYSYETLFGEKLKGWAYDPAGNSTGGFGLKLTTRDMARFGSLYLNNGVCNKKQILSKTWIEQSIIMHEGKKDFMNFKYGYMWWLQYDDIFSYSAIGDGGNIICCIPQKDLIIAISSTVIPQVFDRWQLIKDYILPAITD